MINRNVELDEAKLKEYRAFVGVIKETVKAEDIARVCLANRTLRSKAGYDNNSDINEFNPYIKDFLDKLEYDEHNRKVKKAKQEGNSEMLVTLSNEVMQMAGYKDGKIRNPYAKSFVDRTLLNRQLNKLYKAKSRNDIFGLENAYRSIFQMSSYSSDQPYDIVNEFAQNFVDNNKKAYERFGVKFPVHEKCTEGFAI